MIALTPTELRTLAGSQKTNPFFVSQVCAALHYSANLLEAADKALKTEMMLRAQPVQPAHEVKNAPYEQIKKLCRLYLDDEQGRHQSEAILTQIFAAAAITQPAPVAQAEPAQMQRDTIRNMATAAHAIDFWDEYFDYVNSDPTAHSDMLQIARLLRNPSEEIARLRGEIGVMCGLMDQALDVMQTVNGDDDDEDRKILRLRAKMASAIDHFRGAELLPATAAAQTDTIRAAIEEDAT